MSPRPTAPRLRSTGGCSAARASGSTTFARHSTRTWPSSRDERWTACSSMAHLVPGAPSTRTPRSTRSVQSRCSAPWRGSTSATLALGGGNHTVNVCPSNEFVPPFHCTEGPSMRHVVDLGDVDGAGGFILPAGQSGNPRSRHYRDQTERWIRGELWIIPVDVRRVHATDTLRLTP